MKINNMKMLKLKMMMTTLNKNQQQVYKIENPVKAKKFKIHIKILHKKRKENKPS